MNVSALLIFTEKSKIMLTMSRFSKVPQVWIWACDRRRKHGNSAWKDDPEEGIKMVRRYDAREPSTLQVYCDFLGITRRQFYDWVEPMRDERIWKKDKSGEWQPQDAVFKHENGEAEERERVAQAPESEEPCPKKTGACTTTPLIHRK